MRYPLVPFLAAVLLLTPAVAGAQQLAADVRGGGGGKRTAPRAARRVLTAARLSDGQVQLDGRTDEPAWQLTEAGTDFVTFEPAAGLPASQRTEARVLYDDGAVYVALRAFDSAPDSIIGRLARRDVSPHSDWLAVAIDSYFDRRTAFVFSVNPRGARNDALIYDDGAENDSWDPIWDVATAVDSLGWTAEFRIPLSQLRFSAPAGGADQLWGIQFQRKIGRSNEVSFWSPMEREANGLVSFFGELHGIRGLQPRRNVEVLPYSLATLSRSPVETGDPFRRHSEWTASMGADFKYGLSSNLTLSGTLNPDFGQVEADPSTVNLTAFETFLDERRPFFVEGADIFNFGIGIGDGDLGNESLFYSRRIGRAPQASTPDDTEYSDEPAASTILGAAKLSGKSGGWSIGVLEALTARETAPYVLEDGTRGESVVEPLTNYSVMRLLREFDAGQSAVGGIVTATNRRLDDVADLDFLRTAAYTAGLNARHRWSGGNYEVSGWLVGSHVRGDTAAINRTQRSAARYFQRPDNEHTTYDPTRTSLTGWAGNLQVGKLGGGNWRWISILNVKSPEIETNDLGFQQNADQVFHVWYVGYQQNRPGRYLNRWHLNTNQWNAWTFGGEHTSFGGNLNGGLQLKSFWGMNGGLNHDRPIWSVTALRGGPAIREAASTNLWTNFYSDSRKPVQASIGFGGRREQGTTTANTWVEPYVRVRAGTQADVSIGTAWQRYRRAAQYVTRKEVNGNNEYVFSELDQTTVALMARVNYTFSPTLSLQLYAQPFISAGRYRDYARVDDPRARAFDDRFQRFAPAQLSYDAGDETYAVDLDTNGTTDFRFDNPDFNVRELRSNAVLRWEYRRGSTLYLVWSQGRDAEGTDGSFRFGEDVRGLFGARPRNVLLVKGSWWVG